MSWEGYYQQLCENGHYTTKNAEYQDEDKKCSICNKKIVWINIVDITNGSFDKEGKQIDGSIALQIESTKVCEHCNSILEIKYKIPTRK